MPLFRLSLGYAQKRDAELDDFATNVVVKMTINAAVFPGQTANVTAVGTAQVNYHASLAAAKGNGRAATADKEAKRAILEGTLRTLALSIQAIPGLTSVNAELSGFDVIVSGPHPPVDVDVPVILGVTNPASTKLGIQLEGVYGAKAYEFRAIVGSNPPVLLGTFPSTRGIVLENLVPGTLYVLQVRAVFGYNRFSEWSEPVSHMCT
jgi:hypothetical protein